MIVTNNASRNMRRLLLFPFSLVGSLSAGKELHMKTRERAELFGFRSYLTIFGYLYGERHFFLNQSIDVRTHFNTACIVRHVQFSQFSFSGPYS